MAIFADRHTARRRPGCMTYASLDIAISGAMQMKDAPHHYRASA
ncbi:hypothetical protein [Erwinia amylovora]|uniref:Uncharacterized protein n=3 Tax=Erwinia amylovora TaxID=552 RepID=A0A831A4M9_ERWAM|nr:hypothetical protein [Erwinia amylovora]EKV53473.1 hypothetical protein EaACW_2477 [Erwinia amylovora ACW56400]CBA21768.1 hypothetical protein predicted by Glimmer/Critica [Erwinia amylovora CFBP1430]CBX81344.1 hypothetical protein predicted by Glimmer/Critica [Erwinia amylovora ATCC BAA-2158]CCO79323.1 hypothetical protein BN432_2537 [Erwinia amylovora Ea356]CCO83129.1 hypothetical protein BN433_2570 [Erwinia amylovora Ea266]CCO86890.1 hypothetical protein BN434_2513 [Erwinia amylovora CF